MAQEYGGSENNAYKLFGRGVNTRITPCELGFAHQGAQQRLAPKSSLWGKSMSMFYCFVILPSESLREWVGAPQSSTCKRSARSARSFAGAREARSPSPAPWAREARPPKGSGVPWAVSAARAGARVKQGTNEQGCLETRELFNGFSGDSGQTLIINP